jgi:hypothetical protein
MAGRQDRNVPITPMPDADRACRARMFSLPLQARGTRVAELRRRVRTGYYASDAMMELVARLLLRSTDL